MATPSTRGKSSPPDPGRVSTDTEEVVLPRGTEDHKTPQFSVEI